MRPYFEKMDDLGKPLRPTQIDEMAENMARIEAVMKEIDGRGRPDQERVGSPRRRSTSGAR